MVRVLPPRPFLFYLNAQTFDLVGGFAAEFAVRNASAVAQPGHDVGVSHAAPTGNRNSESAHFHTRADLPERVGR